MLQGAVSSPHIVFATLRKPSRVDLAESGSDSPAGGSVNRPYQRLQTVGLACPAEKLGGEESPPYKCKDWQAAPTKNWQRGIAALQ
jgi:hypothetical protein